MTSQKGPIPAQSPAATLGDVLAALGSQQDLSETRRRDLRSAVKRVAALLGDAPERIPLVSQAESGGRRRLDEDLSQSPVRFPGRREGEWPPFGQTSRPCALEPLLAGALDPTRSSRPVALRPLRQRNRHCTARGRPRHDLSSPRSAPKRCIAIRTTFTARSPRSGTRPRNAPPVF